MIQPQAAVDTSSMVYELTTLFAARALNPVLIRTANKPGLLPYLRYTQAKLSRPTE
jgi:hypothetical protein